MKNFGEQVLDEIKRRGMLGEFFDYAGYQALKQVSNIQEMRELLQAQGYKHPEENRVDPLHFADFLTMIKMARDMRNASFLACLGAMT